MEPIIRTYAKLVDGQLVTTCAPDDETDLIEMMKADGFKLYDQDAGEPEVGKLQTLSPVYREEADRISLRWEVIEDPEKVKKEIARLESEIANTDYKVIKSYEYALSGEKPPYDIAAVHTGREELREQIRELKEWLAQDEKIVTPEIQPPDESLMSNDEILPDIVNPGYGDAGDTPATSI